MMVAFQFLLSFVLIGCAVGRKDSLVRRLDHAHHAQLARRNDGADPLRFAASHNTANAPGSPSSAGQMHFATDASGFTGGEMIKYCPKDFFIGTAVDNPDLKYPELEKVVKEFHYFTPGNSLKMALVYENENSWTDLRTGVDRLVGAGKDAINWKYHTLIWGAEQSQIMMQKSFSKEAMMKTIVDFVETKMCPKIIKEERFYAIDVLNEIFADDHAGFKNNGYFEVIGEEGYKQILKLVKQKCPGYKLVVNEYGLEGPGMKADFAFKTIKQWLAEGVPVDVVGLQFHIGLDNKYEDMLGSITRWTKEKIAVVLSEVDIPVNLPPSPQDLEKQAQQYGHVFQAALEGGAFGVTVWGTLDQSSWFGTQQNPGVGKGKTGAPLLFGDGGKPKPAVAAIVDVFKKWGDKPVGFEGGRLSDSVDGKGASGGASDRGTQEGTPTHPVTQEPKPKDGSEGSNVGAYTGSGGNVGSDGNAVPIIGDPTGNGSGSYVGSGNHNAYDSGTPADHGSYSGHNSGDPDSSTGPGASGQHNGDANTGKNGDASATDVPAQGQTGDADKPKKKKHHGHQGHHKPQEGDTPVTSGDGSQQPFPGNGWSAPPNTGSNGWPAPYNTGLTDDQKPPSSFGNGVAGIQPPVPDHSSAPVCSNPYDSSCNADAEGTGSK